MELLENNETLIQRTFIPGENWLYFKIYSGPKTADTILAEDIKPLVEKMSSVNIINKWFFIRYSDPKLHIRVRFYLSKTDYLNHVISLMNSSMKPYVQNNLIWKIQLDTYEREIERYGENTIDLIENLFCYDSNMHLDLLSSLYGDEGETTRWLFGLKAIDQTLIDFVRKTAVCYKNERKLYERIWN